VVSQLRSARANASLPIEQGGVGTRESMSNLTGAPGLSGLIVAGENDRMGATTDGCQQF